MGFKGRGGSQCLWGSGGGYRGLFGSWSTGWTNWMRIIRAFREWLGRRMRKYKLWATKGFSWGRPLPKSKRKRSLLKRSSWGFWSRKRRNSNNTSHRNTTSSYRRWLQITKNCYPNKERRLAHWWASKSWSRIIWLNGAKVKRQLRSCKDKCRNYGMTISSMKIFLVKKKGKSPGSWKKWMTLKLWSQLWRKWTKKWWRSLSLHKIWQLKKKLRICNRWWRLIKVWKGKINSLMLSKRKLFYN